MSRLKANTDFQRVRREGRSWSHPLFVLTAAPNRQEHTRVGFSASRALGSAVARNRAKRRLREAVRRAAPTLQAGWDMVLVARPGLADADWTEVTRALAQLLARSKIGKEG